MITLEDFKNNISPQEYYTEENYIYLYSISIIRSHKTYYL